MSIVFNFSGNVTIHVSGAGSVANAPADLVVSVGGGDGQAAPVSSPVSTGDERNDTLLALLNDPKFKFRKIGTLADAIGADEDETETILESLGARQERSNDELWGLISRVGNG